VQLEVEAKIFRRYREVIPFREIRGIRGGFLLITGHEFHELKLSTASERVKGRIN